MSQCTTSSSAAPAADPSAKPIKLVPPKSVLNSHGCGGACTDPDFADGRWPRAKVLELFNLPFNDLLWQAQQVHRAAGGRVADLAHGNLRILVADGVRHIGGGQPEFRHAIRP